MEIERIKAILSEAGVLAERINRARLAEEVPSPFDTVRLCELIDILQGEQ